MSDEKPAMEIIPAETGYPLKPGSIREVLEIIDENLAGRPLNVLEFPKIKLLSGGALNFRLEGAGGDETPRTLEGIIVAWRSARIYWKKPYGGKGGGTKPPDCTSANGWVGIGDPGGDCSKCPYARFGSAINPMDGSPASGQACKDIRQALVLLPGQILPHLLNVTPTSVKNFTQYTLTLSWKAARYWSVVTRLSLDQATNEDGVKYAKINFRMERPLTAEEQRTLQPYQERMKQILMPSVVDATAYDVEHETGGVPIDRDIPADSDVPF
jgi:hypothetical protein